MNLFEAKIILSVRTKPDVSAENGNKLSENSETEEILSK